jgi:hypothetical protein
VSSAFHESELVLDAWPVLEWVKGREPARSLFHGIIENAVAGRISLSMFRINHGEVIYFDQEGFSCESDRSSSEGICRDSHPALLGGRQLG